MILPKVLFICFSPWGEGTRFYGIDGQRCERGPRRHGEVLVYKVKGIWRYIQSLRPFSRNEVPWAFTSNVDLTHITSHGPNAMSCWTRLKGHFTHEPRAMTMKLWEPKRKCPKAVPRHLQNHVVWSRTLKCSVMSYVIGPSIKCYFNDFLFMWVLVHDKIG